MQIEQYLLPLERSGTYVAFRAVANAAGTEAWFARAFERDPAAGHGADMPLRPLGEFVLRATAGGVEVVRAVVRTEEHLEAICFALDEAHRAALNLLYRRHPLGQDERSAADDYLASLVWEDEVETALADLDEEGGEEDEDKDIP